MTFKTVLLAGAASLLMTAGASAKDFTIVSWGGAYQNSQNKAYVEPYAAEHPDINFIWDESSNEAVAKLRAMNEAGNVTWDLVDVVASDAIRLCDEGLAMEIDADEVLAKAPDGSPASEDFGDLLVSDCFIPQIVYSTTFGYRTDVAEWNGKEPDDICAVLIWRTSRASVRSRSVRSTTWSGPFCATACRRTRSMTSLRPRKASIARLPSSARSRTRSCGGRPVPRRRSFSPTAKS